jgi:hypothetical protein
MSDRRLKDIIRFYSILNQLEKAIGAARALADCRGRMKWPSRGVYFFHETGENRSDTCEAAEARRTEPPCERINLKIRHTPSTQPIRITRFHASTRDRPVVGMSVGVPSLKPLLIWSLGLELL